VYAVFHLRVYVSAVCVTSSILTIHLMEVWSNFIGDEV
jgi:hypothetical protein